MAYKLEEFPWGLVLREDRKKEACNRYQLRDAAERERLIFKPNPIVARIFSYIGRIGTACYSIMQ